ncbi:MAG: hypothetical protein OIF50_01940 [Flavobacteriaceae bacterium]|nr:hypothetical protein [Flavobacteriaceae bacterium]
MKKLIFLFLLFNYSQAQDSKEVVYILFDKTSHDICKTEVEETYENKEGVQIVKKYRKKIEDNKTVFHLCDQKFIFNPKKHKKVYRTTDYIQKLAVKSLEDIKEIYYKGNDFKHHTFKQINIIEKISETKVVIYKNVYWCCEWVSED